MRGLLKIPVVETRMREIKMESVQYQSKWTVVATARGLVGLAFSPRCVSSISSCCEKELAMENSASCLIDRGGFPSPSQDV